MGTCPGRRQLSWKVDSSSSRRHCARYGAPVELLAPLETGQTAQHQATLPSLGMALEDKDRDRLLVYGPSLHQNGYPSPSIIPWQRLLHSLPKVTEKVTLHKRRLTHRHSTWSFSSHLTYGARNLFPAPNFGVKSRRGPAWQGAPFSVRDHGTVQPDDARVDGEKGQGTRKGDLHQPSRGRPLVNGLPRLRNPIRISLVGITAAARYRLAGGHASRRFSFAPNHLRTLHFPATPRIQTSLPRPMQIRNSTTLQ